MKRYIRSDFNSLLTLEEVFERQSGTYHDKYKSKDADKLFLWYETDESGEVQCYRVYDIYDAIEDSDWDRHVLLYDVGEHSVHIKLAD